MYTDGINKNQPITLFNPGIARGKKKTGSVDSHIKTIAAQKDTFQSTLKTEREKLLETIKLKIKDGYYNSEEVTEDLSTTFANIIKESL